jgi:hypothetical protein
LKTFNLNFDEELNLLDFYNLTPTELTTIRTILLAKEDEDEYLFKFNNILTKVNIKFRDILLSLQSKGIILKSYKIPEAGTAFDLEEVQLNKAFVKRFYKASFELGKELFDTYPAFGYIGESLVALRGVAKKFNSLEDFFRFYGKSIKWNPETHSKIIELVQWAKDNTTFLNCSISSFVINQWWNELEALKNGEIANINFNAIRML